MVAKMGAVVYEAPRQFQVTDVPVLVPRRGEVLLAVEMAGMCGTDLRIHEGGVFSSYPLTPGHEIVGRVESLGEGVRHFTAGQRSPVPSSWSQPGDLSERTTVYDLGKILRQLRHVPLTKVSIHPAAKFPFLVRYCTAPAPCRHDQRTALAKIRRTTA
jgi:NADPH:quinone reductase-like Zn-dependent oxidoreductase